MAQHVGGFRSGTDALLLAAYVLQHVQQGHISWGQSSPEKAFVELGCGDGLGMSLVAQGLATYGKSLRGIGFDVHVAALEQAQMRAKEHALPLQVACVDVAQKKALGCACADLGIHTMPFVLSNPPYYKAGAGRISQDAAKATALHQGASMRADAQSSVAQNFCDAAYALLPHHGWFFSIYAAENMLDMLQALQKARFGVRSLMPVHTRPHKNARWVLIAARKDAAHCVAVQGGICLYARAKGERMSKAALTFCPWLA